MNNPKHIFVPNPHFHNGERLRSPPEIMSHPRNIHRVFFNLRHMPQRGFGGCLNLPIASRRTTIGQLLLPRSAQPEHRDVFGCTALHLAAHNCHLEEPRHAGMVMERRGTPVPMRDFRGRVV